MSDKDPANSRIAIKFGASKAPLRPSPASALGKRARPHLLGGNASDSESDGEGRPADRAENITTIGAGADGRGRDTGSSKKPLTIPRQANRDWKSEKRARTNTTSTRQQADKEVEPVDQGKPLKWGLTLKEKGAKATEDAGGQAGEASTDQSDADKGADAKPEKTADEEAMEALLDEREDKKKRNLVIARAESAGAKEEEAFKQNFRDAPDVSTLEDYEEMPVEEFGAALLRGMGWDGKPRGPKTKDVKRRPNQMGLGAKDLKGQEDLGAWDQKGSSRSRPKRLNDYKREERERQDKRSHRGSESYKQERDRERYAAVYLGLCGRSRPSTGHRFMYGNAKISRQLMKD
ncbi:pre-mRNA-splicing factor SPP2 [Pyricularia oryzae 70-15]|uniref:Pre-mRNA-splicing factor SPP2 n=4 Tax=Pyricularia oryzae TaxID=318829 RepID=SPP2_PYRO7|nr:pre-mRNA-splicing factor SPP2 [Pyricularia oryzae 70-15]Q52E73.3 RecName: Full=Pre-mRNA-splicing factor SPP2 [Pyricularia oryzae 70-15]KAI7925377.1 pre-mRNA-splicing factor SPP2 [Pyricularia oryzae]EHA50817.1 pre-mRNA-splicing factor SPP2 [Pyricularia oryzae 70-15]KAI7925955.1 pre-mRNA-splicing factor SPP2 [Pyricularia oryzae]QBZ61380.1 hypothetical protein PoMZ_08329 [Pyricularia oryzae]